MNDFSHIERQIFIKLTFTINPQTISYCELRIKTFPFVCLLGKRIEYIY